MRQSSFLKPTSAHHAMAKSLIPTKMAPSMSLNINGN
jgi:hypothetical protein